MDDRDAVDLEGQLARDADDLIARYEPTHERWYQHLDVCTICREASRFGWEARACHECSGGRVLHQAVDQTRRQMRILLQRSIALHARKRGDRAGARRIEQRIARFEGGAAAGRGRVTTSDPEEEDPDAHA
jgi:hypothetical protein